MSKKVAKEAVSYERANSSEKMANSNAAAPMHLEKMLVQLAVGRH